MLVGNSNIAAVILAAGASSRMGSPKQLLAWGDGLLINHAIKTVTEANVQNVFVVLGSHAETVFENIEDSSVKIIRNENWKEGLSSSIAYSVRYIMNSKANFDAVFFILADQPLVTSKFLNLQITNFMDQGSEIITTQYEDGKKGVPALFHKKFFSQLSQLTGDSGAYEVIKKNGSKVKALLAPFENIDLDTLDQYEYWHNNVFGN